MVSVYAVEEESVSRAGEDFGEDSGGESGVLTVEGRDHFNGQEVEREKDIGHIFSPNLLSSQQFFLLFAIIFFTDNLRTLCYGEPL